MWESFNLISLVGHYKILLYPFIFLLIVSWFPLPLSMLFGRWRRW